jgi:hypothetical protein
VVTHEYFSARTLEISKAKNEVIMNFSLRSLPNEIRNSLKNSIRGNIARGLISVSVLSLVVAAAFVGGFSEIASAQEMSRDADSEGAFLDPKYPMGLKVLQQPPMGFSIPAASFRNDVEAVIALQTPVKSQGHRGTCSIFSATGMLESHLVSVFGAPNDLNLSEEWLEYVVHLRNSGSGSNSRSNFRAFSNYGSPRENYFPYIGEEWESLTASSLAQERCGDTLGEILKICLIGHRNPQLMGLENNILQYQDAELFKARQNAFALRDQYLGSMKTGASQNIYQVSEVKALLSQKIPITLDIDFYYGAWNHREAAELGLTRNMDHWARGIVGYPAPNSKDREVSPTQPAGHSIILVGYDDNIEVKVDSLMADGTTKSLIYRGVYYFKNSWGTDKFGVQFMLNGNSYPGYGMITQQYAHDFGQFFQMLLKK